MTIQSGIALPGRTRKQKKFEIHLLSAIRQCLEYVCLHRNAKALETTTYLTTAGTNVPYLTHAHAPALRWQPWI